MARRKSTEIVVSGSNGKEVANLKDMENLFAADAAEQAASAPAPSGPARISTSDQQFRLNDVVLPSPLEVIVVAESLLNVWYEGDYDPKNPNPPSCFAVGTTKDGEDALHAHPTSPNIQGGTDNHDCKTCELNKFGSAERGKGKACANTRQLAVVFANDVNLRGSDKVGYCLMSLSPTALPAWGEWVTRLTKVEPKLPTFCVITRFKFDLDNPNQNLRKRVVPQSYQILDPATAKKMKALREEILSSGVLIRPLPVDLNTDEKKPKAKAKAKRSVKTSEPVPGGRQRGASARF